MICERRAPPETSRRGKLRHATWHFDIVSDSESEEKTVAASPPFTGSVKQARCSGYYGALRCAFKTFAPLGKRACRGATYKTLSRQSVKFHTQKKSHNRKTATLPPHHQFGTQNKGPGSTRPSPVGKLERRRSV